MWLRKQLDCKINKIKRAKGGQMEANGMGFGQASTSPIPIRFVAKEDYYG